MLIPEGADRRGTWAHWFLILSFGFNLFHAVQTRSRPYPSQEETTLRLTSRGVDWTGLPLGSEIISLSPSAFSCFTILTEPVLTFLRELVTSPSQNPCFAVMRTKTDDTVTDGPLPGEVWGQRGSCLEPRLSGMDYRTCTDSKNITSSFSMFGKITHLWRGWILQTLVHFHILLNLSNMENWIVNISL